MSYAKAGRGWVAYQVVGSGAADLLIAKPPMFPIDLMWDEPGFARFLDGLSSFSRSFWFDQRGTGASDMPGDVEGRLPESMVEDMLAVLDDARCETAVVVGLVGGSAPAMLFAATHPERTKALLLWTPAARYLRAVGYPGITPAERDAMLAQDRERWGNGWSILRFARALRDNERFVRWCERCQRLGYTPEHGQFRAKMGFDLDMRALLPAIHVPTLACYREGWFGAEHGRYVADNIDGARCVVLEGDDCWWFLGDSASLLDVVEEFVTGGHAAPAADRVLATVMFSDMVHSTEQTARIGDRRWRELLAAHDDIVQSEVDRCRGREIKSIGDGFLATFDGPGRALHCASAVRDAVRSLDIDLRVGVHTGEIELRGDDIAGLAVIIAQRIQAAAEPGQILASRTVVDLVAGSGIGFTDRGARNLKGIPGDWQLYALDAWHQPSQF